MKLMEPMQIDWRLGWGIRNMVHTIELKLSIRLFLFTYVFIWLSYEISYWM